MVSEHSKDISVSVTSAFMKLVGFWLAANDVEERRRNFAFLYTVFIIVFSVWIQTRDLYYSWGDLGDCLYIACNILSLTMVLFKIFVLFIHKDGFHSLIIYMQRQFWHTHYDVYEKTVFDACKRLCAFFVCLFTFLTEATVASYIIRPLVENIGKNDSDRILLFNMNVNLPLSTTPYFEIMYVVQVLTVYHIGLCYFCFDNFLCIMNLHAATQFRILQYRMENINKSSAKENSNQNSIVISPQSSEKYYMAFRSCIRQHQRLITYCSKLDEIFQLIVLGQVLIFSLLICLDGYQVLMANAPNTKRLIFMFHLLGSMCQLLMFTYSCDCVMQESTKISSSVYVAPWTDLSMSENGRRIRRDLMFVIMRARMPCCLSASGFFIVSLQTYTSVLSTAMSYFTLLNQRIS